MNIHVSRRIKKGRFSLIFYKLFEMNNKSVQSILLSFLLSGLLFAIVLYALDAAEGKDFSLLKFVMRMVIGGSGMTLIRLLFNKPKNYEPRI